MKLDLFLIFNGHTNMLCVVGIFSYLKQATALIEISTTGRK